MTSNSKWMLSGQPPEPATWADAKPAKGEVAPSKTHTGTDPLGRAVGPNEDHTKPKKIRNAQGRIVTPESKN